MVETVDPGRGLTLLGLQSRFGDEPFKISGSLSPRRGCGPKRAKRDKRFTSRTQRCGCGSHFYAQRGSRNIFFLILILTYKGLAVFFFSICIFHLLVLCVPFIIFFFSSLLFAF